MITVETTNPDVTAAMDADPDWAWLTCNAINVTTSMSPWEIKHTFLFEDADAAMMFKLTFGGRV